MKKELTDTGLIEWFVARSFAVCVGLIEWIVARSFAVWVGRLGMQLRLETRLPSLGGMFTQSKDSKLM